MQTNALKVFKVTCMLHFYEMKNGILLENISVVMRGRLWFVSCIAVELLEMNTSYLGIIYVSFLKEGIVRVEM